MEYSEQRLPRKTSGIAIAALIFGILAILTFGILAPLGLILSIIALVKTDRNDSQTGGKGMAIAGTAMSGCALLAIPILAAILFPVFSVARQTARNAHCASNLKQISVAASMYRNQWDGRWPLKENWADALLPNFNTGKQCFSCPAAQGEYGIAYNAQLSGMRKQDLKNPGAIPAFFDGPEAWNAYGSPKDIVYRHRAEGNQCAIVVFADGQVSKVQPPGGGNAAPGAPNGSGTP